MEMMLLLLLGSVKSTLWTTLLLTPNEYYQAILKIDPNSQCLLIAAITDYLFDNSKSTKPSQGHTRHVSHPLQTRHVLLIPYDDGRSSYPPD